MTLPTFSVVIESENLVAGGVRDVERCLNSLERQTLSPHRADAVYFVDGGRIPPAVQAAIVARYPWTQFHRVDHPVSYFEAKMIGSRLTRSDVVVFVDSDMEYEPQWLETLLGTFVDIPGAEAVCGDTEFRSDTVSGVAMSLSWMLVSLPPSAEAAPATHGYRANNVAFRPAVLDRYPIPFALPLYRVSGAIHYRWLAYAGVRLIRQPKARGFHTVPESLQEWLLRLMVFGRDHVVSAGFRLSPDRVALDGRAIRRWRGLAGLVMRIPPEFFNRLRLTWRYRPGARARILPALPLAVASTAARVVGAFVSCFFPDLVLGSILRFEARAGVDWSQPEASLTGLRVTGSEPRARPTGASGGHSFTPR